MQTLSIKDGLKKCWHIVRSSAFGFWDDDCYNKAATLTFYTLQSIVPFLAAALAIAKGFGFDDYLEKILATTFAEQREIIDYAIQFALSMLRFISSGEIVGMGVILLLWTNINLVAFIELTLNEIWKVKISRSLFQKIKDFCFALVVLPLIFVASSSATLYVKAQIHSIPYFSTLNQLVFHEVKVLVPWMLSCFLFGSLYFLIPNAKLRVVPRLLASLLAGTAFQLWQVIFINLQLYIFSYNVVYGAFALLPLFLIWLQFSWIIALAGAEFSAHIENFQYSVNDLDNAQLTKVSRRELGLLLFYECVSSFYNGGKPVTLTMLSENLKVPQKIIGDLLDTFEKAHVLVAFRDAQNEVCYSPLYDPDRYKLLAICELVDRDEEEVIVVEKTPQLLRVREALEGIHKVSIESAENDSIRSLFRI